MRRLTVVIIIFSIFGLSAPAALTQDSAVFEAEVLGDSFLVHESIPLRLRVENRGSQPFARTPLLLSAEFVVPRASSRNSGEAVEVCLDRYEYAPSADRSGLPTILPGDMYEDYTDVLLISCSYDPAARMDYWPAGDYQLVLDWHYDPHGLAVVGDSPILTDTTHFVVVEPRGADALACEAFLNARRLRFQVSPASSGVALWEVAQEFSESPFAAQALLHLLNYMSYGEPLPAGVDRIALIESFVFIAPERPECSQWLRYATRLRSTSESHALLTRVRDSLKCTFAGNVAARLLSEDHNESTKP